MSATIISSSTEMLDLVDQVEQAVQVRTGGRIRDLQNLLSEGRVIVSGRTSTYYLKQLATHAIRDAVDDLSVQNDVEVC
jgi:hypothetical protein